MLTEEARQRNTVVGVRSSQDGSLEALKTGAGRNKISFNPATAN
jgi:hypothetical protein